MIIEEMAILTIISMTGIGVIGVISWLIVNSKFVINRKRKNRVNKRKRSSYNW